MKYLIYIGPGIGDFMLILPTLKVIKSNDCDAYIKLFTRSDRNRIKITKELLKMTNFVDSIDYYNVSERLHLLKFIINLFIKRFDYGICVQYVDNNTTSIYPSKIVNVGAKRTIGTEVKSIPKIKFDYTIKREEHKHITEYFKEIIEKIGIERNMLTNIDCSNLLNRSILKEKLLDLDLNINTEKVIAICIGTGEVSIKINKKNNSMDLKSWSYKSWIELTNIFLSNDKNITVILLGGVKEALKIENFKLYPTDNIINLIGKLTIIESIAVIERANVIVGADTGLMHCAGILNKPCITLFGCTDYKEYLLYGENSHYIVSHEKCSPCFGTENMIMCKDKKCMKNITVDMVYNKIKEILNEK